MESTEILLGTPSQTERHKKIHRLAHSTTKPLHCILSTLTTVVNEWVPDGNWHYYIELTSTVPWFCSMQNSIGESYAFQECQASINTQPTTHTSLKCLWADSTTLFADSNGNIPSACLCALRPFFYHCTWNKQSQWKHEEKHQILIPIK